MMFSKEEERTSSFSKGGSRKANFGALGRLGVAARADKVGEVLVTACKYSLVSSTSASISLAVTGGQSWFGDWELMVLGV